MDDGHGRHNGSGRPRSAGPGRRTTISGRRARQGQIVLNTRRRRAIFIGGLAAVVVVLLVLAAVA